MENVTWFQTDWHVPANSIEYSRLVFADLYTAHNEAPPSLIHTCMKTDYARK